MAARRVHLLRLARLERGRRVRRPDHRTRAETDDREVRRSASTRQGAHRGRRARSSPARARSACSRSAGRSPPATTRTREKSAETFRDVRRASAARSRATARRSRPTAPSTLLGRGSVSINTGGEKIFPEEVEEAVKLHPAVADCDRRRRARRALRRGGHRGRVGARRRRGRAGPRSLDAVRGRPRRLQAPAPRRRRRRRAARPERQSRLQVGRTRRPREQRERRRLRGARDPSGPVGPTTSSSCRPTLASTSRLQRIRRSSPST